MAKKNIYSGVWFNPDYVKRVSESQFVKHFEKVYPNLDLRSIYKDLGGGKPKK